jgi:MFS superfamily sulfate permease-like transporter
MNIILLITCYSFISTPIKNTISILISNPIVILFSIICIVIIGFFDINIAVLLLILFFLALFAIQNTNEFDDSANIERFTSESTNSDDDEPISRINNNLKAKAENDKKIDERVNSIKNVVLSTINKFRNTNDSDYKKAILENKKMMYNEEKINNKARNNNTNTNKRDNFDNVKPLSTTQGKAKSTKAKSTKAGKQSEEFQTVQPRTFDPSNEEDTNLLITKEILQDMSNRIEYNYESNKYLKKYIKHRVEEIVDLNKLIEDE